MGSGVTDADEYPHRPGQRVGHYEIIGGLGRGGMGFVYRARDLRLPRDVALKCPKPGSTANPRFIQRFTREGRAASQLSSPYVVPVFEVFEAEGSPWLAMELVEGQSLRQLLREQTRLPLPKVLKYAERVARALQEAHEKGILHRDVNPNNIMIGPRDQARLMDFGLARIEEIVERDSASPTASMPLTGQHAVGTLGYMSPEQALGRKVDPRADIFSLGVVIHEMCTGQHPFTNVDEVLHKQLQDVTCLEGQAPVELVRLVHRATAKDPEDRYQNALHLLADLETLRRFVDFKRYAKSHPTADLPQPRRGSWVSKAALAAVALLILVMGTWYVSTRMNRPARTEPGIPHYRLEPLATWPTEEAEARISPDLQWVSFLSNRDGQTKVWLRRLKGDQTSASTPDDHFVLSHAWSPDASELAYLRQEGPEILIEIVPAPLGNRPRLSVVLGDEDDLAPSSLVRWVDSGIYIWVKNALWRFEDGSASFEPAISELPGIELVGGFDVHPDGERAVFSAYADGQENLWSVNLDGSDLRQVTHDSHRARQPLWIGGGEDRVCFLSNRTGQVGLWSLTLEDGAAVQIPLNRRIHDLTDASADAGVVAIQVTEERADLWALDPTTQEHRPLIDDALADMLPFASRQGPVFAFQRIDPGQGAAFLDSQIVLARWVRGTLEDVVPIAGTGSVPKLSSDGRWLTFLRRSRGEVHSVELWLKDLSSHRMRMIADRFQVAGFYDAPLPTEVVSRNHIWAHETNAVFFTVLAEETGVPQILRLIPGKDGSEPALLVSGTDPDQRILHLSLSPDDERIAYVVEYWGDASSAPPHELRVFEIGSGRERVVTTFPPDERIRVLGWVGRDDNVLVLRQSLNSDLTNRVEVLTYDPDGRLRKVGVIDRAFGATARLIPEDDAIYITAVGETGHNLFVFSLATGESVSLTRNRLPGVTFSGITRTADGVLVQARQVENYDVWILLAGEQQQGE